MKNKVPSNLQEAVVFFNDYQNCKDFMVALRWPDGKVTCPRCGSEHVTYLEKARLFKCYGKHEKPKFSLKTGTVFEDSPIGLEKWLPVVWMLVNAKNGVSSWEIHRSMGVTQKTAWFMLQRVRLAMQAPNAGKLGGGSGEIEVDESYIGGKARNMHKDRKKRVLQGKGGGASGKVGVQGILERGGEIRVNVINDAKHTTLVPKIRQHVKPGAHLFTDEAVAYFGLQEQYAHDVINHAEAYAIGNVHTNGLENFWSLMKRHMRGTYVCVEPFHLFRYMDEQVFRYNHRRMTDAERFVIAMDGIVGRRVTYQELIGKVQTDEGPRQNTREVPF